MTTFLVHYGRNSHTRKVFVVNSLDLAITSAVMRLHALGRALHDAGPWTMTYADMRVPAERLVLDDGVSFAAEFPRTHGPAWGLLLCGDDFVMDFDVTPPNDGASGPFIAEMSLRLDTSVVV